jgi:hypothetical protein
VVIDDLDRKRLSITPRETDWLDPEQNREKWEAQVVVEVHAKGTTERIYYHDHLTSYATREEALEASREFGRRMVENFTVPAYGEGDYKEPS